MRSIRIGIRFPQITLTDVSKIINQTLENAFYCNASLYRGVDLQHNQPQQIGDIKAKSATQTVDQILRGNFGRIFNERSELRWQYCDDDKYDVLLITEENDQQSFVQGHWIGEWDTTNELTYYAKHGNIKAVRCTNQESGHTQFVCFRTFETN